MTLFADKGLAQRLEAMFAAELRLFVDTAISLRPDGPAVSMDVAGGAAVYVAPGSPLNQAAGLGMDMAVASYEIAELERFFSERETAAVVVVCPMAHPSLLETLAHRGWVADGFENVLVRELAEQDAHVTDAHGIEITEVRTAEERKQWAWIAANGFCAPFDPPTAQLQLATIAAHRRGARLFIAHVDGAPAGTGELSVQDGIAWLSADATLPQFRAMGVQSALQSRRLAMAAQCGCALAVSETSPGSASQRNMERHGFRVAYTRVDLHAPEEF